jgi:hypothetical protein
MDGGDLATWVGSSFAAIAAGATLWTLKSQRDQIGEQRTFMGEQREFIAEQSANLQLERAELRAAAEDRRKAQAQQIKVHQGKAGGETDGRGVRTEDTHWQVTVSNRSSSPIHDVEVRFGSAYLAAEVYAWPINAHFRDRAVEARDRMVTPVPLLGPERAARFHSQSFPPPTLHNSKPSVAFTDDGGVRWTLDFYGKLEEAAAQPGA